MMLTDTELEMLKLCALGRFVPCSVAGKYDLPELRVSILNSFVRNGYLKIVKGEQKCYRLTRRGRDILYNAGYIYPDDSRPRKEGAIFNRRIINAEINALFHSAGIDIYAGTVEELSKSKCAYISSLTIRSQTKSKVLAGTRFYGILRMRDTAFVVYYVDSEHNAIFPNYEEQTFLNIISGIDDIKHIAVMLVCKDLKEITEIVYPDVITKLNGGYVSFAELMNKWKYDFYMLPLNRDGQFQMRVSSVEGLRESIAERFGRKEMNYYDAVSEDRAFINIFIGLGSRLDYVITYIDRENNFAVASRKTALEKIQKATNRRNIADRIVEADVVSVGKNVCVLNYGGYDVLLRQRDIHYTMVGDVREIVHTGEVKKAKVKEFVPEDGVLKLSIKETMPHPFDVLETRHPVGSTRIATVVGKYGGGVFCRLSDNVTDVLCSYDTMHYDCDFQTGDRVEILIKRLNYEKRLVYGKMLRKMR